MEVPSTVSVLIQFEEGGQAQSLYSTDSPLARARASWRSPAPRAPLYPRSRTRSAEPITITAAADREWWCRLRPWSRMCSTCCRRACSSAAGLGRARHGARRSAPAVLTSPPAGLGYHVLDTLLAIEESAESRAFVTVAEHGRRGRGPPRRLRSARRNPRRRIPDPETGYRARFRSAGRPHSGNGAKVRFQDSPN